MKKLLLILVTLWVGGAAGLWYWNEARPRTYSFRTTAVTRGDLLATINATGTLEPEEVVDVGPQVAGEVVAFGTDPERPGKSIGHGSVVAEGAVLARLGDALFKARVDQANANLAKAEADVEQALVKSKHAAKELERVQRLYKNRQISPQEHDQAVADADTAKASLDVTRGSLALARANLEEAQVNLGYATIRSPVAGVIVDRRVNLGQTVVASQSAPSLFLIARDLHRMQIWASVNETDVGQIHPGQKVRFQVSAFPKESFHGTVTQVRLNASMNQSVVTYTVVVEFENPSGKLLPYLTARVQFEVEERRNVLLVPNSALRWMPAMPYVDPAFRAEFSTMLRQRAASGVEKGKSSADTNSKSYAGRGTFWVKDNGFVRPVPVRVGLSDGLTSEVSGGTVTEGMEVVIGVHQDSDDEGGSPFLPKIKNDKAK